MRWRLKPDRRRARIFAVLAALWALAVWGQSCLPAAQSAQESGALLPWVQELLPWMTEPLLRKAAHVLEFAVLGGLCFFAFAYAARGTFSGLLLCGTAALADETIQLVRPGRSGEIADIWIDLLGYLSAILLCLLCTRLRRKK